jgi:hypothetical protein
MGDNDTVNSVWASFPQPDLGITGPKSAFAVWAFCGQVPRRATLRQHHFIKVPIEASADQKSFQNTCYSPTLSIRRGSIEHAAGIALK